jgi:hypothetical protein
MAVTFHSSTPEPTISDIEQVVQTGLQALRSAPLSDEITKALKFLAPSGYRPVAQFEEDGRKKRSTAAASNWNPETGEIVIYFEREEPEPPSAKSPLPIRPLSSLPFGGPVSTVDTAPHAQPLLNVEAEVTQQQIQQCCEALADAEKAGKAFIALKWFRDTALMSRGHDWTASLAHRQAVLTKAIDVGAIVTSPIPNPKAPQHLTTTIKLNRESSYARTVAPRYQPVRALDGASASEIVLRDRGRF